MLVQHTGSIGVSRCGCISTSWHRNVVARDLLARMPLFCLFAAAGPRATTPAADGKSEVEHEHGGSLIRLVLQRSPAGPGAGDGEGVVEDLEVDALLVATGASSAHSVPYSSRAITYSVASRSSRQSAQCGRAWFGSRRRCLRHPSRRARERFSLHHQSAHIRSGRCVHRGASWHNKYLPIIPAHR